MTVAYRRGAIDDAPAIAAVFEESFTATFGHIYPREDLETFLATKTADRFRAELADARYDFIVAASGSQVVGYVKLGPPELPVETPPDTVELCQFYLLNYWQGKGVAAELMHRALEGVREKRGRHVQLSVYVDNHRARRFYERYGFQAVGNYHFMVGRHADEDIVLRHMIMQADK